MVVGDIARPEVSRRMWPVKSTGRLNRFLSARICRWKNEAMWMIASNGAISLPKITLVLGVIVSQYFAGSAFRPAETYLLCDPGCV